MYNKKNVKQAFDKGNIEMAIKDASVIFRLNLLVGALQIIDQVKCNLNGY